MSDQPITGANGYIPTVTDHHTENGVLVLETLDPNTETDLVTSRDSGSDLIRRAELLSEETQHFLSME